MTTIREATPDKPDDLKSAGEASSHPQSEHDQQIRFSRDFSEATSSSSGPSSLIPESLSSASSFQSLASTLSSKSSSGICADSAPGSPDKTNTGNGFDHSYVNVDIPDLDDLISACANINLGNVGLIGAPVNVNRIGAESPDSSGDLSQDQTFTSAADDTISDKTQILVEETNQTFDTCLPTEPTQVTKVTSTEADVFKKLIAIDLQPKSSVIPYLSFEESVLRKHQEPVDDGAEFKTALTNFQANQSFIVTSSVDTRRRSYSPTPCEEIDVAQVAKLNWNSPKNLDTVQESLVGFVVDETAEKKEVDIKQECVLGTPDASFPEIQAFNSTTILNAESTVKHPKLPDSLNITVSKTPSKSDIVLEEDDRPELSFHEVPVGVKSKEINVVEETISSEIVKAHKNIENPNVINKIQDIVHETNVLNKTQDLLQEINIPNKIAEVESEGNTLNKSHDNVQTHNILNKTQDIGQQQSDVIQTELIIQEANNSINNNQVIVQEVNDSHNGKNVQTEKQILNKVDNFVEEKEILKQDEKLYELDERPRTLQVQESKSPKSVASSTENTLKSSENVEEIFLKPEIKSLKRIDTFTNEDPQNIHFINTEAFASTPLPVKHLKKSSTPPKVKSELFSNGSESIKFESQRSFDQNPKNLIKSSDIKEEKNKLNFDQTLAVNKSLEKSSFSATDIISEIEESSNLLNEHSFTLPTHEPEYEAFKPIQQSTNLPFADFQKLQEAALSVAKEIDESLENIEETEHFVSATTGIFEDPSALDFLSHVGSQQPTNPARGARYDSLYMKFDPLVQRLSMLPQKNLPTSQTADEQEEKEKETKVDTPISEMGTPKKNPALAAIDRLLFYSPCPPTTTESAVAEAKQKREEAEKQEIPDVPVVDEKMAKELELVRSTVLQLESEIEKQKQDHTEELEKLKTAYEEKVIHIQTKFTQMQSQLTQEVKCKGQMTVVVEEYEKSISRLIAEREKDRTSFEIEKAKLQEELQVANQHLSNTEAAFSDVHSKYERLKNVVSAYKSNETVLKESIAENQETIKTLEGRYEQMKSHAVAQLEKANLELNAIKKQNEAETVKLKALVRKAELKSKSLAETVEQKIKENKELTLIIDEMIARVD